MPGSFGASGHITVPSRQNPTLVMVPSEILVHQQALVEACGQRGLAEPVLAPAADVLEPGKRPLEMRRSHRVRAVRPVLRPANGDDHPGPVAVDADTGVRLAAESMPDAAADLLATKRPPVHLMVRRLQPGQVQVQTARPATAHLHRREMAPPLVLQKGHGRLVGVMAVDLDPDVIAGHSQVPPAGLRERARAPSAGRGAPGHSTASA